MTTIGSEFAQTLGRALTELKRASNYEVEAGLWSEKQWQCFHQLGATQLLCSGLESDDELGASLADFMMVAARLGEVNAAFAGVESIVAASILQTTDISKENASKLLADTLTVGIASESITASDGHTTVRQVPWGRFAQTVLYLEPDVTAGADKQTASAGMTNAPAAIDSGLPTRVAIVNLGDQSGVQIQSDENIAGEARDSIKLPRDSTSYSSALPFGCVVALLALGKAAQMTGAMQQIVQLSADYVSQRRQFGRPLSKFQAIQHILASMYAETVAATVAARAALRGNVRDLSLFDASAAIVRTRESATKVAALAHQAHGAMGFTDEYALADYSRRLWAWRDEYHSERQWQQLLGQLVLQSDQSLLEQLTDVSG